MVHTVLSEHASEDFEYGGYVEGEGLFAGEYDVVVTDGFTGNVALKIAEATGRMIGRWLKGAVTKGPLAMAGALLLRPAFRDLKAMLNPDSYGAAPLLGVNGVAYICHGRASSFALATSLKFAERTVSEDLIVKMADALARNKPLFEASKAIESAA
jgi:glycerol-3-phosphate acyltransferase PlsX